MDKLLNGEPYRLFFGDCLDNLKKIPDGSVDLVATDPPYFRVKQNAWDNQWPTQDDFLQWLDLVLVECSRVLKPNGSIYVFCGVGLNAETELLIKNRFQVLNHIVWHKPRGIHQRQRKESLRRFFPGSERIIFAEKHGESTSTGGYGKACYELQKKLFAPLIQYFADAKKTTGISSKQINEATGVQMASHWFSASQWKLPNEEQYLKLQALFNEHLDRPLDGLRSEYQTLNRQYHELKAEYERLRRPFSVTKDVPYTDVWSFDPVQHYPGKHPCEKPAGMMEHIVRSSSRPGDVVLDCFMGSASTGKAALKLGRRFIGMEFEEPTFDQASAALSEL